MQFTHLAHIQGKVHSPWRIIVAEVNRELDIFLSSLRKEKTVKKLKVRYLAPDCLPSIRPTNYLLATCRVLNGILAQLEHIPQVVILSAPTWYAAAALQFDKMPHVQIKPLFETPLFGDYSVNDQSTEDLEAVAKQVSL